MIFMMLFSNWQKKFKMAKKKVVKKTSKKKGVVKKARALGIQFIPFSEVEGLKIAERVKKILKQILGNRIVVFQGRLRPEEEARLIEDTMAMVDHIPNFSGIEIAVIEPDLKEKGVFVKVRHGLASKLTGLSTALTVIGPASIIKEIKKDPKKLELMLD
jgi:hypothetical protein